MFDEILELIEHTLQVLVCHTECSGREAARPGRDGPRRGISLHRGRADNFGSRQGVLLVCNVSEWLNSRMPGLVCQGQGVTFWACYTSQRPRATREKCTTKERIGQKTGSQAGDVTINTARAGCYSLQLSSLYQGVGTPTCEQTTQGGMQAHLAPHRWRSGDRQKKYSPKSCASSTGPPKAADASSIQRSYFRGAGR